MEKLTKVCKKCGKEKSINDFYLKYNKNMGKDYRSNMCKTCFNKSQAANERDNQLQRNYGINEAQYELMLKAQNGVCAICGQLETVIKHNKIQSLSVNHDHKTFKIRGLLCNNCNRLLGNVNDNSEVLRKATIYLEKYK